MESVASLISLGSPRALDLARKNHTVYSRGAISPSVVHRLWIVWIYLCALHIEEMYTAGGIDQEGAMAQW